MPMMHGSPSHTHHSVAHPIIPPHLDNGVWHAHLLAECGQPEHKLQGVHIVGNDHELGLAALNEGGDVVDTVLHNQGLLLVSLCVT